MNAAQRSQGRALKPSRPQWCDTARGAKRWRRSSLGAGLRLVANLMLIDPVVVVLWASSGLDPAGPHPKRNPPFGGNVDGGRGGT